MEFADYLSPNPSSTAPEKSDEDENFVINTMEKNNLVPFQNELTPNGANINSAEKTQVNQIDVIIPKQTATRFNSDFCVNAYNNQSHLFNTRYNLKEINLPNYSASSQSNLSNKHTKVVAIHTRKNQLKETYSIPIKKRY